MYIVLLKGTDMNNESNTNKRKVFIDVIALDGFKYY